MALTTGFIKIKNMACKIITKLWDFPFQEEFKIDNIDQGEPYSRSGYGNK